MSRRGSWLPEVPEVEASAEPGESWPGVASSGEVPGEPRAWWLPEVPEAEAPRESGGSGLPVVPEVEASAEPGESWHGVASPGEVPAEPSASWLPKVPQAEAPPESHQPWLTVVPSSEALGEAPHSWSPEIPEAEVAPEPHELWLREAPTTEAPSETRAVDDQAAELPPDLSEQAERTAAIAPASQSPIAGPDRPVQIETDAGATASWWIAATEPAVASEPSDLSALSPALAPATSPERQSHPSWSRSSRPSHRSQRQRTSLSMPSWIQWMPSSGRDGSPQRSRFKLSPPSWPARKSSNAELVGLRIGSSHLAAALIRNGHHTPELLHLAQGPLERGVVVAGEVREPDALAAALRDFFAANKLPRRSVRLGIASNRIGVRVIDVPAIDDPKLLENAIRFRAQELLSIPINDAVLDHVVLGEGKGPEGPTRRVLVAFAHRELIDRYVEACKKARLRLVGIDFDAFALLRAVSEAGRSVAAAPEQATVAVSIGHERTIFAVSDGSVCDFTRVLEWGGASLNVGLARALNLAPSEAGPLKHGLSLIGDGYVGDGSRLFRWRRPEPLCERSSRCSDANSSLRSSSTSRVPDRSRSVRSCSPAAARSSRDRGRARTPSSACRLRAADPFRRITSRPRRLKPPARTGLALDRDRPGNRGGRRCARSTCCRVRRPRSSRPKPTVSRSWSPPRLPLVAAGLVFAGYAVEHSSVTSARGQAREGSGRGCRASAPSESDAAGQQHTRRGAAGAALGARRGTFEPDRRGTSTLVDLARVLPANVWLTSLDLTSPTPADATAPSSTPNPRGAFTIAGLHILAGLGRSPHDSLTAPTAALLDHARYDDREHGRHEAGRPVHGGSRDRSATQRARDVTARTPQSLVIAALGAVALLIVAVAAPSRSFCRSAARPPACASSSRTLKRRCSRHNAPTRLRGGRRRVGRTRHRHLPPDGGDAGQQRDARDPARPLGARQGEQGHARLGEALSGRSARRGLLGASDRRHVDGTYADGDEVPAPHARRRPAAAADLDVSGRLLITNGLELTSSDGRTVDATLNLDAFQYGGVALRDHDAWLDGPPRPRRRASTTTTTTSTASGG